MAYGLAKTGRFMLSTASLLIGAQADALNLTQATHSVGLIKNVNITSTPSFTELTQGVKNTPVASVLTGNDVNISGELYEYTAQNIGYMAQINGATMTVATNIETTATAATSGNTGSPVTTLPVASATGLAVGDYIMIQNPNVSDDTVIRRISAITGSDLTLAPGLARATVNSAVVRRVNFIPIGSKVDMPYLSATLHGQLADGAEISVIIPKVRITGGLNLGFQTNDFGNMPVELRAYDLVPTDTGYAEYGAVPAVLFT